ncbi:MAG: hypothetical protein JWL94_1801 [Microbacteriaceae bacterium]|jgi:rhodanese-related sulfurtransferase|nr:hypothetical protein [Microbacteriaceae bacterium]HEV7956604.1 rhodanese-like domain-containing protein [Marisediminicola sp.]
MNASTELSAREAIALVGAGDGMLLDVREQHEWDRGHSPFATLLPMTQLQARIGELPNDRRLLVVCHSGQRSARVTEALLGEGFDAVNVAGGMVAWHAAGGTIVADGVLAPRVD